MDKNEEFKSNLVNFLKLFKNRPYHLAKYLVDNSALSKSFSNKIMNSDKLTEDTCYFSNISDMNEFYNSILDIKHEKKSYEEIEKSLNEKMNLLILSEKYEEAGILRDYMIKNNIKRLK